MMTQRPHISTFLLKVASRCNLACDYCFMFRHIDQSWRQQPPLMSEETMVRFVDRLARYVASECPAHISLILHGGEPLLAPIAQVDRLLGRLRTEISPTTVVDVGMQTNATLLSTAWLDVFDRREVTFSISLDGDVTASDRHRRDHNGASSYRQVLAGLERIHAHPAGKRLFSGVLAVIDLRNDPEATLKHILSLGAPAVDFLLPDGTYDNLPPGLKHPGEVGADAPYGRWLSVIFDTWYDSPEITARIRLFESIMDVCLGGQSQVDSIGPGEFSMLTVQTDGEVQDSDVLKITFPGAAHLGSGYSVYQSDFTEVLRSPHLLERARLATPDGLCATCRACHLVNLCGGGYVPHRYKPGNGFDNPSIYCGDLAFLIRHIQDRLSADLALR